MSYLEPYIDSGAIFRSCVECGAREGEMCTTLVTFWPWQPRFEKPHTNYVPCDEPCVARTIGEEDE